MRKIILGLVCLFFLSTKAQAITGSDLALTTPYLVKSALGLKVLHYLDWPRYDDLGSGLTLTGIELAVSVGIIAPDLYTLGSLAFAEPREIRMARKYAYVSEMVTGGIFFISGFVWLAQGDRGSEFGLVPTGLGLILILAAQLNLISFDAEKPNPIPSPSTPIISFSIPF